MNIKLKITDKFKEDISLLLKQERNAAVKERLYHPKKSRQLFKNSYSISTSLPYETFSSSLT